MARLNISKYRTLIASMLLAGIVLPAAYASIGKPKSKAKVISTRQTIEGLEEEWRKSQLEGDAGSMDHLLSDDFVGITAFGKVTTKAQFLARIRDRVVSLTQLDLTDIKVKVIGSKVAVVTSRAEIIGQNEGIPIKGTFRYTRVYQRSGSVWRITSFEATRADRANADPDSTPSSR